MASTQKKKLLVLDVNGLLLETYFYKEMDLLPPQPPDAKIGNFFVYKRPFCDQFLQFCLENFVVGIWSSARKHNVDKLVEYLFQGAKDQLAFLWHQADCTNTGINHPENKHKPVFLKELFKLWEKLKCLPHLEAGEYGPTNTLLVDDSPYKALRNPPHTAIFPRPYTAHDVEDSSLCGVLRKYLEGLCDAVDVQGYVKQNPFGEPSITIGSPLWDYYKDVLKQDHVHSVNLAVDPRSLVEIRTSSERISGLSIEASPEEQLVIVKVADNERVPDLDAFRDSASSSTEHVSLHASGNTDVKVFSFDQNKQGNHSDERSEQVGQMSKQHNRSDRRFMCEDSGDYRPKKLHGMIENPLHTSIHENSHSEGSRKHSRETWVLWRKSSDRESQIHRKGKLEELNWSRNTSSKTPRYNRGHQSPYILSGDDHERFPFGSGELSHTPPSNLFSGNSDRKGRFYPSCGSDMLKDGVHVNQGIVRNSRHSIRYNGTSDSSDRNFDVYQNRPRPFDRSIQQSSGFMEPAVEHGRCMNAEPVRGTRKQFTYGASQHHFQYGPYSCIENSVELPISKYMSSTTFEARPPVSGINQHSRYYLGHEQHSGAIPDLKEHLMNESNSNRSVSYYAPSARIQRPPFQGDLSFSSRFPFKNKRMTQSENRGTLYSDSRSAPRHHFRK